uniref:U3 small nucleolar RNA-associated protein 15 homolog n=1 Tax=Astyanax mexicanus TaxID=7994 RepID=A0A8B9J8J2_ASTMX
MASFKPTKVYTYPKLGEKVTEDTLYWKNYKAPVQIKEFGAVTKIEFSPVAPHNYVVTASTRIQVYRPQSQEPVQSFTRFRDTAYGGSFRGDGKLVVAGSEEGLIRLFDVGGRVALRQFRGHSKYLHTHYITKHSCQLADACIWSILEKCLEALLNYYVMTMQHGHPVESVLLYPSEALLVSAGGRYVKVWDLLKGGQQLVSLKNHHKTVTCACLSTTDNKLLTGSLDRHVKVYNSSYKVVHNFDYATSILSLAVAPDDEVMAVGMTNGVLSVRQKKHTNDKQEVLTKRRRTPAYRVFKGKNYIPKQDDFLVSKPVKQHLQKYDRQLKSFQVSKALDSALETWRRFHNPEVTVAVMIELNRRGTLKNALSGRDEQSLTMLLNFLIKHVTDPRFSRILLMVSDMIIDLYHDVAPQSSIVERLFQRLLELLGREAELQQELLQVLGILDTLFASLAPRQEVSGPAAPPIMLGSQQQAA